MSGRLGILLLASAALIVAAPLLIYARNQDDDEASLDLSALLQDFTPLALDGGSRLVLPSYFENNEPIAKGPTLTPTPLERERAELEERGKSASFKVEYRASFGMRGGQIESTDTIYQLGVRFHREDDVNQRGHVDQTYKIDDVEYACGWQDEPTCLTMDDMSRVLDASIAEFEAGFRPETVHIPRVLGTPTKTPTETPMPTVEPTTTAGRTYAGQPVICFVSNDGESKWENCFTSDGIEMYMHYLSGSFELKREAISFSRDVTEADFALPYPLVEPTFAPTPSSPPIAH